MKDDDRLIFLLARAHHCLRTYLKQAYVRAGLEMTPVQSGILFLLGEEGRTMTQISRELGIDNSATTGLVDRLERAGLARRRPHPSDRRTLLIEITEQGRASAQTALELVKQANEEIQAGFSAAEIAVFKQVVNSFFVKFKKDGRTS